MIRRVLVVVAVGVVVVPAVVREIGDWLGRRPEQERLRAGVTSGRVDLVRQALAEGADPNRFEYEAGPPLLAAVRAQRLELARVLLEHGAEPDRASPRQERQAPLVVAVEHGSTEMVRLLLEHGADPAQAGGSGAPLVFELAWSGNLEMLELMLDAGANPDLRDSSGAAWEAAVGSSLRNSRELAERFESMRRPERIRDPEQLTGVTPLMLAARREHVDVVRRLLAAGADPNARDDGGATPLVHAARSVFSNAESVAALLAAGADPSLADAQGRRPVDYAEDVRLPRPDLALLLRAAPSR